MSESKYNIKRFKTLKFKRMFQKYPKDTILWILKCDINEHAIIEPFVFKSKLPGISSCFCIIPFLYLFLSKLRSKTSCKQPNIWLAGEKRKMGMKEGIVRWRNEK